MSSSPSCMTLTTLLKLSGPVSSSEQGASRNTFVHSFAAYCTVAGMGEEEEVTKNKEKIIFPYSLIM